MMARFDAACDGNPFSVTGPAGRLECLCEPAAEPAGPVAVICHPHPQHGGALTNKVVHTLARTFNQLGADSLRFNFRGVGHSQGEYADGVGEIDDLLAVVAWVRGQRPDAPLWLAGFSFGGYIAAAAAARTGAERLVTVAPAVNLFDFGRIDPPGCPWLIIHGDADEIVPYEQVRAMAGGFSEARLETLPGAGHFFHGRLNDLRDVLLRT